ncbi:hypothetical protein AB0D49_37065 [Streptomyces sp. NPDC048290]|uniref:hypothetical protein n=1 Tax=Streptomyces sp. NPDC048290 TaxID=3155811 RepID=UPI0034496E74
MRVRMAVAVVAVAGTVLTGCGGADGRTGAAAPTTTAASASAAARTSTAPPTSAPPTDQDASPQEQAGTHTNASARQDIEAAADAGAFGELVLPPIDPAELKLNKCQVVGRIETEGVPDRTAMDRLVAVLHKRGWEGEPLHDESYGVAWSLESGDWMLNVTAGSLTKEQMVAQGAGDKARDFSGVVLFAVGWSRACVTPPSVSP